MNGMLPSGLHVNKPVIVGLFATVLTIFLLYRHYFATTPTKMATQDALHDVLTAARLDAPPELDEAAEKLLERESKEFEVTFGEKKVKIHVEQVVKSGSTPKLDIMFLHGAKFSSKDWLDIKTTDHVANWGYRAVAIDLPGTGKSPDGIEESPEANAEFLGAFISALQMKKVVIIAPSASGRYALPYLFQDPKTSTERAVGLVAVAPVGTQDFTSKYPESEVPTLIVYGSKDIAGATALNNLQLLPKREIAPIEGAGHACYLDAPEAFHKVLFHFLQELAP